MGGPPTPPDPYATAMAQNSVNEDAIKTAAKYDQVNQSSPFGNSTYSGTAGDAKDPLTQTTTLNPALQQLLTSQTGVSQGMTNNAQSRLAGLPTTAYNLPQNQTQNLDPLTYQNQQSFAQPDQGMVSNVQGAPIQGQLNTQGVQRIQGPNSFAPQIQQQTQAAYNAQTGLLQPGFQQQSDQLKGQLAAQGIPVGSDAYNQAIDNQQRTQGQIQQQAAASAVGQGLNAQGQLFGENLAGSNAQFGQALQSGQFGNSAQAQGFDQGQQNASLANSVNSQQFGQNAANASFFNQAQNQNMANAQNAGSFNNSLYQQGVSNDLTNRNQQINELAALFSGSPVSPSNPQFQGTPQYQPAQASPNLVGLAGSDYQAQAAASGGVLGSVFGALGSLGGAAIGKYCWVAREVYGVENPRWLDFREWMLNDSPAWFRNIYLAYGERFAAFIKNKPRLKAIIKRWMESRLG